MTAREKGNDLFINLLQSKKCEWNNWQHDSNMTDTTSSYTACKSQCASTNNYKMKLQDISSIGCWWKVPRHFTVTSVKKIVTTEHDNTMDAQGSQSVEDTMDRSTVCQKNWPDLFWYVWSTLGPLANEPFCRIHVIFLSFQPHKPSSNVQREYNGSLSEKIITHHYYSHQVIKMFDCSTIQP